MSDDTRRRLRKGFLLSSVAVIGFCLASARAEANPVDPIDDWSAIGNQVIVVNGARAGLAQIDFAYMYIAIYDAVNAIDGGHSVFAVRPTTSPAGASPEAAVAAAAYNMSKWLFPAQGAMLDGIYANYLLGISDGPAMTRGTAVGTEVAQKLDVLVTV